MTNSLIPTTMTSHDKIIRMVVRLQRENPFFSYILMNFKMARAGKDMFMPTMGVDKYGNLFYADEFVEKLTTEELRGTLVHEALHLAKGDFFRRGTREPIIWNIASDCVINWYLTVDGFTLPKCGILPDKKGDVKIGKKTYNVANKTTEQVYEMIEPDIEVIKICIGAGDGDGKGHGGFDVHIEGKEGDTSKETQEGINQAASQWKKTAVEAATIARQRGNLPGCAQGIIDEILNPTIDWRKRIRQFITQEIPVDYCNRLPGRKFYGTGVWFPRVLRENLEVMVSVDCSGSTCGDRVDFVSEICGILLAYEQVKARIIFWETTVNPENDIEINTHTMDKLKGLNIKDINGGTYLTSYTDYVEEKGYKSRLHVILTDGVIESEPRVPNGNIIFVLSKNGQKDIIEKYGAVCNITDRDR